MPADLTGDVLLAYLDALAAEERFYWGFHWIPENPKQALERIWAKVEAIYDGILQAAPPQVAISPSSADTPKRHFNRCQKTAYDFLLRNTEVPQLSLVFGHYEVRDKDGEPILGNQHVWIEIGRDVVFDGVAQRFFDLEDYYLKLNAGVMERLSAREAIDRLVKRRAFW